KIRRLVLQPQPIHAQLCLVRLVHDAGGNAPVRALSKEIAKLQVCAKAMPVLDSHSRVPRFHRIEIGACIAAEVEAFGDPQVFCVEAQLPAGWPRVLGPGPPGDSAEEDDSKYLLHDLFTD